MLKTYSSLSRTYTVLTTSSPEYENNEKNIIVAASANVLRIGILQISHGDVIATRKVHGVTVDHDRTRFSSRVLEARHFWQHAGYDPFVLMTAGPVRRGATAIGPRSAKSGGGSWAPSVGSGVPSVPREHILRYTRDLSSNFRIMMRSRTGVIVLCGRRAAPRS